jgi:hypothetical protein
LTVTVRERLERGPWRPMQALAVAVILFCSGCGPIQVASAIGDAEEAIEAAISADAHRYARYEYWMAVHHLDKAKRVDGRAEYWAAEAFAAGAVEYATDAIEAAGQEKMHQQVLQERLKARQGDGR